MLDIENCVSKAMEKKILAVGVGRSGFVGRAFTACIMNSDSTYTSWARP